MIPKEIAEEIFSFVYDPVFMGIQYFLNWALRDPYFERRMRCLGPVFDRHMRPGYANYMTELCTLYLEDGGKIHRVGKVEMYLSHKHLWHFRDERRPRGAMLLASDPHEIGDHLHTMSFAPGPGRNGSYCEQFDVKEIYNMTTSECIDHSAAVFEELITRNTNPAVMCGFRTTHPGVFEFDVFWNVLQSIDPQPKALLIPW